ncbi:hypothetical protein CPB84DRAFT_1844998 [Gymnopilus junonius]|uniref:Uncharacterized protein n=1 Tax=Gymnopilus junonius TaxID=109634 RepID=A0A9P5TPL9_GYMJU|nr:hypothetical protein CPB84DRAFT_1844998 [Gymnopilus junonius]
MGDRDPILFFGSKAYAIKYDDILSPRSLPSPKTSSVPAFLWSLLDIKYRPKEFLVRYPCSPVQTTSLDRSSYKTWYEEQQPLRTGLPLWTRDELVQRNGTTSVEALCKVYPSTSEYRIHPLVRYLGARELLKDLKKKKVAPSAKEAIDYLLEEAINHVGFAAHDVFSAVFNFQTTTIDHKAAPPVLLMKL